MLSETIGLPKNIKDGENRFVIALKNQLLSHVKEINKLIKESSSLIVKDSHDYIKSATIDENDVLVLTTGDGDEISFVGGTDVEVDTSITENSTNPVTSAAIYEALSNFTPQSYTREGMIEEVLFNDTNGVDSGTINLSGNISDYDLIQFVTDRSGDSNSKNINENTFLANNLPNYTGTTSLADCILTTGWNQDYLKITYVNDNTFNIFEANKQKLLKVVGIKFGRYVSGVAVDDEVTEDSDAVVTSGAVYEAIDNIPQYTLPIATSTLGGVTTTGSGAGTVAVDSSTGSMALNSSGVTAGTYEKVTVDSHGVVTSGANLSASDIPSLTLSKITDAGTAAAADTGTSSGNVPVLDSNGKLNTSVLPPLAINNIVTVADDTARYALTTSSVQNGDVVNVTSTNKTYFVIDDTKLDQSAGYTQVLTPAAPVQSVNGYTGVVSLASTDLSDSSSLFRTTDTLDWSSITNKPTFATVATSGSYNDLSNTPTIPTLPDVYFEHDSNGYLNIHYGRTI